MGLFYVPKHITTLELLKNLPFTPRRVVFIDDTAEHVQKMYEALTAEGIESYCFMYSKAHNTSPLDYFMPDLATIHLTETEAFLEKLLSEEDVDEIFRVFYK